MYDLIHYGLVALSFLAGCGLTYLFMTNKVNIWRIRWIEIEHDLARLQNRNPKNIDSL